VFNVGPLELIVVLIIALIVLGPQRLPDVARSLGRGMREFRSALDRPDDEEDEDDLEHDEAETKPDAAKAKPGAELPAAATAVSPDEPGASDYQKDADSSEPSSSSRDLV
jgi:sec-independent protein translocase protein TatA